MQEIVTKARKFTTSNFENVQEVPSMELAEVK